MKLTVMVTTMVMMMLWCDIGMQSDRVGCMYSTPLACRVRSLSMAVMVEMMMMMMMTMMISHAYSLCAAVMIDF